MALETLRAEMVTAQHVYYDALFVLRSERTDEAAAAELTSFLAMGKAERAWHRAQLRQRARAMGISR
ncbi:MAG: hypothetical protein ABIL09_13385 [Gemmatimonadota bacterium]